jgi:hypothetical protein
MQQQKKDYGTGGGNNHAQEMNKALAHNWKGTGDGQQQSSGKEQVMAATDNLQIRHNTDFR